MIGNAIAGWRRQKKSCDRITGLHARLPREPAFRGAALRRL